MVAPFMAEVASWAVAPCQLVVRVQPPSYKRTLHSRGRE